MIPAEVIRQVRRLHLRARRLVLGALGGVYHSAFKGAGLIFEEVREYQPGDDVRTLDWNVTARTGRPFVKRYVEERELTLLLVLDLSGSMACGTGRYTKRAAAAELAALLALCAVSNDDRVGLVGFTSRVERFLPPRKGTRHALRLLRDVLAYEPRQRGTDLAAALDFVNRVQRRRAVVFILSDFLATDYEPAFRRAARRHDLVAIHTIDPRERDWPAAGLVRLEDAETGQLLVVDTGDRRVQDRFAADARDRAAALRKLARVGRADVLEVGTDGTHGDALLAYFRQRDRRRRHA